jgi:hypothetical protein
LFIQIFKDFEGEFQKCLHLSHKQSFEWYSSMRICIKTNTVIEMQFNEIIMHSQDKTQQSPAKLL